MQLKKSAAKIIIWTVVAAFALSGFAPAYADEYHDVRYGEISFTLPDGWTCDEIEAELSDDMVCEQIAETYDHTGNSTLSMDLYYADDDVDEYEWIYFRSNKDDAMEYFDKYGKAAVQSLYAETGWYGDVSMGEPELYDAEYNTFLTVPVSVTMDGGEEFSDVVYLTCDMTEDGEKVIHMMLRFYNDDGSPVTESQQEDISLIADEFYDYGYRDDSTEYCDADDSTSDDFSDVMEVIFALMSLLLPIAFAAAYMVRMLKKKKTFGKSAGKSRKSPISRKSRSSADDMKQHRNSREDGFSSAFKQKRKDDFSAAFSRKHSVSAGGSRSSTADGTLHKPQHPHDHIRPSNADERYMESLLTLRKSGLLTKEEMQDMLERHERNRMYRR